MKLVVNTNRIIAGLIKDSKSRQILTSDKFDLLTVSVTKSEIKKYKQDILDKTEINDEVFNQTFSKLFSKIEVVEDNTIVNKFAEAKNIMDKIDPKDTPFISLGLSVENDGIWSDACILKNKVNSKSGKLKIY